MDIDVIIPVYRPGKELFSLLDKLESQSLPIHEIILMNTEEKFFCELVGDYADFRKKYPNVQVHHLRKAEFDHGDTRRRGVEYSVGEVFLCMTQDAMPADAYLVERLVESLSEDVAAAYARQLPGPDSSELERASRRFN